jgi:hypothetical protein
MPKTPNIISQSVSTYKIFSTCHTIVNMDLTLGEETEAGELGAGGVTAAYFRSVRAP